MLNDPSVCLLEGLNASTVAIDHVIGGKDMSLEQTYYISQVVAVILILGSLLAIFFQQHRTNQIARAEITQKAWSEAASNIRELSTNPGLATAFRKIMFEKVELEPTEKAQILTYLNLALATQYNALLSVKRGLIELEYFRFNESELIWYLTAPDFAKEWRRIQRGGNLPSEFINHINNRFAELYPDHDISTVQA